jgi:hypothetical protein
MDMWNYLGFSPWRHERNGGAMEGVARLVTMIKGPQLLPIAKYYAWDYVVWTHDDAADVEYIMREWHPLPDVVTQRFLLVSDAGGPRRVAKSFLLGLKGFLEVYSYTPECPPDQKPHPRIRDLIPPIDMAHGANKTATGVSN